ncbi:amidohydrolase [Maritimibacter sp. HL-12]|jgi:predicted TIM-barrel fold metal-dependent hydrolase|uniref:amidohydrolase family protein n=1 Tax=Maritimibacter sp. HL-12 TaxID=1162418 RepID=UPI000A0F0560|nr:amidohydrolase [Maritimibacter sp. HL-12]SMH45978.1 Predicted metal-dependent hydrolase, TIM-barrel fold [Maritimibacter sp. HL-12]
MIGLIDTHQHLIYPEVAGYGWTKGIPALEGQAFRLDDYKAVSEGAGIAGTLFMETAVDEGDIRAETEHVAGLASDPANGIEGLIATARPETDEGFEAWIETARGMGAVGFRRILHVVDDEMSTTETFRANIRRIGAADMTFDMCFLARQLPLATELADACDQTRLVLDHCGVPDIAGGGLDPWRARMTDLAARPNVICKLSGIMAYCAPGEASYEAVKPYVDHVLEVFGPKRMIWGSDWPVVNMGSGFGDWLAVTRQILDGLGDDEARAIAQGTAIDVFRLSDPADLR